MYKLVKILESEEGTILDYDDEENDQYKSIHNAHQYLKHNNFLKDKHCIIQINNIDHLCFARALAIARAYVHKKRSKGGVQTSRVNQTRFLRGFSFAVINLQEASQASHTVDKTNILGQGWALSSSLIKNDGLGVGFFGARVVVAEGSRSAPPANESIISFDSSSSFSSTGNTFKKGSSSNDIFASLSDQGRNFQ
uniref:Uncharacterized protein n=1 Tax=Romanomermis culicivorax TaxID=13658 RepID=A0A915KXY1_ROMCU